MLSLGDEFCFQLSVERPVIVAALRQQINFGICVATLADSLLALSLSRLDFVAVIKEDSPRIAGQGSCNRGTAKQQLFEVVVPVVAAMLGIANLLCCLDEGKEAEVHG